MRYFVLALVFLLTGGSLRAWGPHPTITQAALDVLGTNHPLMRLLGAHGPRLTNYCWMADYKRLPFRDVDQEFYADDYLLFPGMSTHLDHICPEVKKSYAPYFRRALQALRTESPANAARWIGSLLHFVEDTGSPPHAAEIRGPTHSKMENWVDATQIHIGGHVVREFGGTEAAALEGFSRRMDELIAFSKPRGLKLSMSVLLGDRRRVEPVALECALETSRVVADLLHTLGRLAEETATSGAEAAGELRGQVLSTAAPRYEKVPARIIVAGTPYSTLADPDGHFRFRNLPTARYTLTVFRPGCIATNFDVTLAREMVERQIRLRSGGSLVRNADFGIRWVRAEAPDCWYETGSGWEGEIIALKTGRNYRLRVDFNIAPRGEVLARWSREVAYDLPQNVKLPRIEARPVHPANPEMTFTASESMGLLQLTIRGGRPADVCRQIELVEVTGE